eukprot:112881_1
MQVLKEDTVSCIACEKIGEKDSMLQVDQLFVHRKCFLSERSTYSQHSVSICGICKCACTAKTGSEWKFRGKAIWYHLKCKQEYHERCVSNNSACCFCQIGNCDPNETEEYQTEDEAVCNTLDDEAFNKIYKSPSSNKRFILQKRYLQDSRSRRDIALVDPRPLTERIFGKWESDETMDPSDMDIVQEEKQQYCEEEKYRNIAVSKNVCADIVWKTSNAQEITTLNGIIVACTSVSEILQNSKINSEFSSVANVEKNQFDLLNELVSKVSPTLLFDFVIANNFENIIWVIYIALNKDNAELSKLIDATFNLEKTAGKNCRNQIDELLLQKYQKN